MTTTLLQQVQDQSHVAEARRASAQVAASAGLNDEEAGRFTLAVSEGATNLLKHAGGGHILLNVPGSGLAQAVFVDSGPGMADTARAMRDGFSTAGTLGGGLGAMSRASTAEAGAAFDLYTLPGKGTAVACRVQAGVRRPADGQAAPLSLPRLRADGVSLPKSGEQVCGDGWAAVAEGGRISVIVADGLGHGPMAQRAARAAITAWAKDPFRSPVEIMALVDAACRSTRGAAAAVAQINALRGRVDYAGIGNIAGAVLNGGATTHCVSMNGTLGQHGRSARAFEYPWFRSATLLMHSDGLATRWSLQEYPGLAARSGALIAAVLHRDFDRKKDDVTVVAVKEVEA